MCTLQTSILPFIQQSATDLEPQFSLHIKHPTLNYLNMMLPSTAALLLGALTSLAASTPLREPTMLDQLSTSTTTLEKRVDPWHYCGDQKWSSFGERAFLAGLRLMGGIDNHEMDLTEAARDQIPVTYTGKRGMCVNLWCGGRKNVAVVFYLCLHDTTPDSNSFLAKDLAQKFHDGFHDCNGREPQDDKDNTALAFHVWAEGYDLHVEGGYDGMKCPGDTQKTRFRRPASLDAPPYT